MWMIESALDREIHRNSEIRKEVHESWQRCKKYGLAPEDGGFFALPKDEIQERIQKHQSLICAASKHMETIYYAVDRLRFVISLTDADGVVIYVIQDKRLHESTEKINFSIGVTFSERFTGTNGLGTSIARNMPTEIFGEEHYCHRHKNWDSMGVPIHDQEGNIIGCIGCSSYKGVTHPHTLGMLMAAAATIEENLRLEDALKKIRQKSLILKNTIESIYEGLITFEPNGRVLQINQVALDMLGYRNSDEVNVHDIFPKNLFNAITSGESVCDYEMNIRGNTGRIRCFVTATPIHEDKELAGIVTVLREGAAIRSLANRVTGAYARFKFKDIISRNPGYKKSLSIAASVAQGDSHVLIQGESGTGKELVAQAIHNASPRANGPFIALNCAAIPKDLLESELFGYEEGTFTGAIKGGKPGKFELASGGTLLLDEIGDMPLSMQPSLLRVLQEGNIMRLGSSRSLSLDVRIIASTNKDLEEMVKKGLFRRDLYFRLNVVSIILPPLRQRPEDIPLLVEHFVKKNNIKLGRNVKHISDALMSHFISYNWPGNVREIENIIEYCMNVCGERDTLDITMLPNNPVNEYARFDVENEDAQFDVKGILPLEAVEKIHIETVLNALNGNKSCKVAKYRSRNTV